MNKLFIVDTIVSFRVRYAIEAECLGHAYDEVTMRESGNPDDNFSELTRKYIGEQIVDGREITKEDFNKMLEDMARDKYEVVSNCTAVRKINYKL